MVDILHRVGIECDPSNAKAGADAPAFASQAIPFWVYGLPGSRLAFW
jgi:hypothetical protein